MKMRVVQAANTHEFDQINGQSCIEYWKRDCPEHEEPLRCRATGEYAGGNDHIVGGHVIGIEGTEPHVYITPILSSINTGVNPKSFDVDRIDLVPVPKEDEMEILRDPENLRKVRDLIFYNL